MYLNEKPAPGTPLDPDDPLNRGCCGAWLLNDRTQKAWDASPYRNHGALANFAADPYVGGHHGGVALKFDGSNDYVDTGSRIGPQNGYSCVAWINPANVTGFKSIFVAYNDTEDASRKMYTQFFVNGAGFNGRIHDTYSGGYRYIGRSVASGLSANVPACVGMSWDGGTTAASIKLYLSGARVDTTNDNGGTFTKASTDVVPFWIGAQYFRGPNSVMNGAIDGVRRYERPLAASEFQRLCADPWAGFAEDEDGAALRAAAVPRADDDDGELAALIAAGAIIARRPMNPMICSPGFMMNR